MHDIVIQSMGGGLRQLKPPHGGGGGSSLKCPRCDSLNTKFCYYNNYNLSQPRFFCKGCRRYWTKGGVLRNVPVGGGCRKKSKRSKPNSGNNNKHNNPTTVAVKSSSGSHSSSNNSSPATITAPVAETTTTTKSSFQETCFDIPVFDTDSHHNMLSDIGMLKGLMTSSSDGLPIGMTSSMPQRGHEWAIGGANGDGDAAAEGWGLFDDHQETYWWDDNNNHQDHHQLNYFP